MIWAFAHRTELELGKLVPFEKQAKPRDAKGDHVGGANILMFTGVRYERGPTENDKPPATTGNKRKRG